MADEFEQKQPEDIILPGRKLFAITPHNSNELSSIPRALWVGTGGDLSVIAQDDTVAVTLKVQSGSLVPVRVKVVKATGTTATDIVGVL